MLTLEETIHYCESEQSHCQHYCTDNPDNSMN